MLMVGGEEAAVMPECLVSRGVAIICVNTPNITKYMMN